MARRTKKKKDYSAFIESCDTGDQMAARPIKRHMKIQAFSGGGKTTWALNFFDHTTEGVDPESCLMTIIDCDLEGQAALIKRDDIVRPEIRSRIYRKVCRDPDQVNEAVLAFIDLHRQHQIEHPNGVRVMLFENEGAYYIACRDFYAQTVHGQSEADLMLSRQAEAISEGKKTLPAFKEGQMHSYKVINRVFFTPFERMKIGAEMFDFHFISTVLLRQYTENYGTTNEKQVVVAAGRADLTDPLFEWIVQLSAQQRTKNGKLQTRYLAVIKKARSIAPFQMANHTPKKFWDQVAKLESELSR